MDELGMIRANAEMVVEKLGRLSGLDEPFGFNRASIAWVESFIEQQRKAERMNPEAAETLVDMLGSFLGESILHSFGGEWRMEGGLWGVFFDEHNGAFPFTKVKKQFVNGVDGGDGILSFFDTIACVFGPPAELAGSPLERLAG